MKLDVIKLFFKNEKELETLLRAMEIYSHDIGMEFGIKKCTMLIMKNQEATNYGMNRTTK